MSNMLHCCHCGRFSLMLSRHDDGLRIDYSYCAKCNTLDRVGEQIPLGSSRLEYLFTPEYEYLGDSFGMYCHFLYDGGA